MRLLAPTEDRRENPTGLPPEAGHRALFLRRVHAANLKLRRGRGRFWVEFSSAIGGMTADPMPAASGTRLAATSARNRSFEISTQSTRVSASIKSSSKRSAPAGHCCHDRANVAVDQTARGSAAGSPRRLRAPEDRGRSRAEGLAGHPRAGRLLVHASRLRAADSFGIARRAQCGTPERRRLGRPGGASDQGAVRARQHRHGLSDHGAVGHGESTACGSSADGFSTRSRGYGRGPRRRSR